MTRLHTCPLGKRALKVTCSAIKSTSSGLLDRTFLSPVNVSVFAILKSHHPQNNNKMLEVDDSVSLNDSIVLCYRGNLNRKCLSSTAVTKTCTWKL